MLTAILLLLLAGQTTPAADDTPDTAPSSAPTIECRGWTGIKAAFESAPVPHAIETR